MKKFNKYTQGSDSGIKLTCKIFLYMILMRICINTSCKMIKTVGKSLYKIVNNELYVIIQYCLMSKLNLK